MIEPRQFGVDHLELSKRMIRMTWLVEETIVSSIQHKDHFGITLG